MSPNLSEPKVKVNINPHTILGIEVIKSDQRDLSG